MNGTLISLLFVSVTNTFNLPPGLLSALCFVESSHRVKIVRINDGGSDSHGVCQLKYSTAKYLGFTGSALELQNANVNIYYAGKYMHYQIDRYNGDVRKAIAAYNAGKYRINDQGLIKNRKYVGKVFTAWAENR